MVWGYCLATLLAARVFEGFGFGSLAQRMLFLDSYRSASDSNGRFAGYEPASGNRALMPQNMYPDPALGELFMPQVTNPLYLPFPNE